MFSIRPFEEDDNITMLDIEKLCPQGNEKCAMGIDKRDIIARYELYENWKVLVAEEEGKVVGWIGWTIKHGSSTEGTYVYITEVMVHPEFRRKGIATRLVTEAEKNARETGSDHIYCYIFKPNDISKFLFEKLGYSYIQDFKSYAIPAYKIKNIAQKYEIERIDKNDIPEVVHLINSYYTGRTHFVPYTTKNFESYANGIPAYGLENYWVVKDYGKIVACAGLWDFTVLGEICYTKEPLLWKVMGLVFKLLSLFGKIPKIPAEGEYLKSYFITDHAFKIDNPDAMSNLIRYFNNILVDAGIDFFAPILDPNDPLFEIIKKFKPQVETWYVFAKAIEKELPEFSPLYLDIRDMIL